MPGKVTETPAGKAGIIAVAVIAVGLAAFVGVKQFGGDGSVTADPKEVMSDAQAQVEQIKKENLPPALKQQMLDHYSAMAQGKSATKASNPPPSSGQSNP